MVNNIAEPDVCQCIDNLGNSHDNTYRANCNTDFVGVEVLQLTDQVCHNAQTELSGKISQIVTSAHDQRCTVFIYSGARFFTKCHFVFLLFLGEPFPFFCYQYSSLPRLDIALFDL